MSVMDITTEQAMNKRAIFDNGGGITVQLGKWANYYEGSDAQIKQAADDVRTYLETGNTEGWEGHEPEAAECQPTIDELHNGGYMIVTMSAVRNLPTDPDEAWGHNAMVFAQQMKANLK